MPEPTNSKPFIVAEIAQGYEGNERMVELFVEATIAAGADAIKFQVFFADELALPDYEYYDLFKSLELPAEVWAKAIKKTHAHGLEFYSDLFGTQSLEMLDALGVDGYKIHATDIDNARLLLQLKDSGRKLFVSAGGASQADVDAALELLGDCQITLMYGFQAEPTLPQDNHLNRIRRLIEAYDNPIGFQDHTAGDSEAALYLPFVALGLGVEVIEKHLTLSRAAKIEDYVSALTAEEFRTWCGNIKDAWASLGEKEWVLSDKEEAYRSKVSRAVCTTQGIAAGQIIQETDVTLKRTGMESAITDLDAVVQRKATRDIASGVAIVAEDIA